MRFELAKWDRNWSQFMLTGDYFEAPDAETAEKALPEVLEKLELPSGEYVAVANSPRSQISRTDLARPLTGNQRATKPHTREAKTVARHLSMPTITKPKARDPLVRPGTYATPARIAKARALAEEGWPLTGPFKKGTCDVCGKAATVNEEGQCRECYTDAIAHGGDLAGSRARKKKAARKAIKAEAAERKKLAARDRKVDAALAKLSSPSHAKKFAKAVFREELAAAREELKRYGKAQGPSYSKAVKQAVAEYARKNKAKAPKVKASRRSAAAPTKKARAKPKRKAVKK